MSKIRGIGVILKNYCSKEDVYYLVDDRDWAVRYIGEDIAENLRKKGIKSKTTTSYLGITNSIIHYGSIHVFMPDKDRLNIPHKTNKLVVTYFHVLPQETRAEKLPLASNFVSRWHTTNNIAKEKLMALGLSEEKITVIPLGIDTQRFKPVSAGEKRRLRDELKIPAGKIVIGSFQKDGVGWGRGMEPKFEKGPEVFCDVVEKLAADYPVFVLLIGPSRGYVIKRMEEAGIPYKYYPYIDYKDIHSYYNSLDLYLITSRIEGGPRALFECMASCVPFVATRVGMAADVVTDYSDGLICEIDDASSILKKARELLDEEGLKDKLCLNMRKTAEGHSWDKIIARYDNEIYKRLG